jgi:transcriptional regulator NrdR family protein
MQLQVIKSDRSRERYMHTKVIGTINKGLSRAEQADLYEAEQLSEVVTYHLHKDPTLRRVSSGEIFSIIKAVLDSTGHEKAAATLSDYHYNRKMWRARVEVVGLDIRHLDDAHFLYNGEHRGTSGQWNKSIIVADLIAEHKIDRQAARVIASMVEEKIFAMRLRRVGTSLIRQLVLSDAASILQAQSQLLAV